MGIIRCELIWSGIEVVITALTRNQVTGNRPWVRIPPAPPNESTPFAGCFHLVSISACFPAYGYVYSGILIMTYSWSSGG